MSKILIIAAGNAQIDAIEYLKKKGNEVYTCSYIKDDLGSKYADHFEQIDIKDIDAIDKYVKENAIDLVYSVGSDLAMPTVMKVSELNGLPHFVSFDVACNCQNKSKMRTQLGNNFEGNIEYEVAETIDELRKYNMFPAIMKPVDSQGQRGCIEVNNYHEIACNFEKSIGYSKEKKVIVERYIDGDEISVNAYMKNGELVVSVISDRISFEEYPGGIIKKHILPSKYSNSESALEIKKIVCEAAKKMGILNGPVYYQIKVMEGRPYILEMTPRLDGCHMWRAIKKYCGIDFLELTFNDLIYFSKGKELEFLCEKPNEIFDRKKYDVEDVDYLQWYYQSGETVKTMNGYMEKGGYKIVETK